MRRSDLAKGTSVLLGVIVAGYAATVYVDRHIPAQIATTELNNSAGPACVDSEGNWTNWRWPNVPALSPKCP